MAGTEELRIASVALSRLFGVPEQLEVSFVPARMNRPVSAIIFGENGSGKSSIAKAIEWTTQDRINRSGVRKRAQRASLLNASNACSCVGWAAVTLSDGTELRRQATWDTEDQSFQFQGPVPLAEFTRSPIVLTRADIISFITNPPSARGSAFMDYALRAPGGDPKSSSAHAADVGYLDQELLDLKRQIRDAVRPIAQHLDRPNPYDLSQIAELIDDLYKGVARNQRHRIRIPRQLEPAVTRIEELQKQVTEVRRKRDSAHRFAESSAPSPAAPRSATGPVAQLRHQGLQHRRLRRTAPGRGFVPATLAGAAAAAATVATTYDGRGGGDSTTARSRCELQRARAAVRLLGVDRGADLQAVELRRGGVSASCAGDCTQVT